MIVQVELQNLQKILEARADEYIDKDNWDKATTLLSFATACSCALELLKEQEAITPIDIVRIDGFSTGFCPMCGTLINNHDNKKACGRCGKQVKWE